MIKELGELSYRVVCKRVGGDQGARRVVVQSCVLAGWLVIKELGELSYRVVCKRVGW